MTEMNCGKAIGSTASDGSVGCEGLSASQSPPATEPAELPSTIQVGLEAMDIATDRDYTPEELHQHTRAALKRYPHHKAEIALTAVWLMFENNCHCVAQKGELRKMMAQVVESMDVD